MDSSVNLRTGGQQPSQARINEASTPAPKFGGIKKKLKKIQLTRRARISLNTSTSGRKKIKSLASKINTSLNSSRIVKEALNHNNRALVTEQHRIQNEIKNMRQKCVDLVEENEDIVYELEMLNNLMNLTDSEEKVQAVVDMRVQAHMSQLTDEIEKTVSNFRQALRGVVSLGGLIKDPRRILSMPLDSPRDDEEIQLSYMERLQEIFSNTDIYDENDNDMINDDDNLPDNHIGMSQVNNTRCQGFVGLPQRIPCSYTVPAQHQVDTFITNEFDEALEDDFDLNSNRNSGNVQNFEQSNGKDLLPDESHQPKYPRSNNMISTELSENYNYGQEDTIMYSNNDMEKTTMIGPSLSPKSPTIQLSVEPVSSSVKSSPKFSKPSQSSFSLSKSSQSSSSKPSQSSSSKSSQSRVKSSASSPTKQSGTSSSLKNKQIVSSPLSSDQPVTKSFASSRNLTSFSSQESDFQDPEHTIYLNSDMEMTAVVEAPFSFIEPQPPSQFEKPSSFLQSLKTPAASEKQNQNKVDKVDKFGPENLFGFEVETPKFNKPTKTTELSKTDKFERLKIETSFTLDKSLGDDCLIKATKSRSRTKPRSKKAVVEEIGIFNSEPSEFHDTGIPSEEKTKSTCIEKSQGTSRSKRKHVQKGEDDFEDSEPCVLLTIPSEYSVPLNKESPSPKKSKPRSQSRGRSKSKKKEKTVLSGSSGELLNDQKVDKPESDTKGCGEQGLSPYSYTVPMKKDSAVSNIKSTARSQSRGRSKTKKKEEIQSVDTKVNEKTQESNITLPKVNKPNSISVTGDLSDVYTVPMKTDSPEIKPKLRTRSQSRGRSKNRPDVSKAVVSLEVSSDATTLPTTKKHSPSKSVPSDNSQNKEHLKVKNQADSKDTYDVPLKDTACSKSKTRGHSQSRARSKKREVIVEDGNGTVVAVESTMDYQNLKEAHNLVGNSDHSRSKRSVATQQCQKSITNSLTDGTRTSQSTDEKLKKSTDETKEHGEDMKNCSYDEDDVISPTVHIKPKCFRKRVIKSDDIDSPVSQIKPTEIKKTVIDDDNDDEMIPNSQPVKPIVPLRSKKRNVPLASETDDELENYKTKSSSNVTSSTKRKSESPIKNMSKKPKSISCSPKQSQILLMPEVLVIPDSTKKSRGSVLRNDDDDEDQENLIGKRSRRTKGCVSYKEKPLNVKMRRETVDGKTVEYINTERLSEKVHVSGVIPLDSVSNNTNSSS